MRDSPSRAGNNGGIRLALADAEIVYAKKVPRLPASLDVRPAFFLLADDFNDAGGDDLGAGNDVGGGEVTGSHGIAAGNETDVSRLQILEVGGYRAIAFEEENAGAISDDFDLDLVGCDAGHEVVDVADGEVPVRDVGGGEGEEDAVRFGLGEGGKGKEQRNGREACRQPGESHEVSDPAEEPRDDVASAS